MNTKKLSKINVTIKQWEELERKELAISEDLRNERTLDYIAKGLKVCRAHRLELINQTQE